MPGIVIILPVLWVLLVAMGPVDTRINKIPGGTMVAGTSITTLEIPYEKFLHLMCAYHLAGDFSDDDVIEFQLPVTGGFARELMAEMPKDPDVVRAMALPHAADANCPSGETKVIGIMDFPWPLRDAWQLSSFDASLTDTHGLIEYEFLAGTAKESSGYWKIEPAENGDTRITAFFHFDIGFRIPEFLIRWAVGRTFPDLFQAMEDYARNYSPGVTGAMLD